MCVFGLKFLYELLVSIFSLSNIVCGFIREVVNVCYLLGFSFSWVSLGTSFLLICMHVCTSGNYYILLPSILLYL